MKVYDKVKLFYSEFKGEKGLIGKSVQNRPIYFFNVKKSEYPKIIVVGAIHGREHVTALLVLKLIRYFSRYNRSGNVFFIPLANPDGVVISENYQPLYKANANGVDLNVNFDAKWGQGEFNKRSRGGENYVGPFPFSEPESKALKKFTQFVGPDLTISYHSKGEEIYYEFYQSEIDRKRDYAFANIAQKLTGYKIKTLTNSVGGYKDWCIQEFKIPALTIEVGNDCLVHPILQEEVYKIFNENKRLLGALIKELKRKNGKIYAIGDKRGAKSVKKRRSANRSNNRKRRSNII